MEGFNLTIILVLLLILFSSMDFKHKIIQWNCRGLKPNYNEVSLLISEYNPSVFCFQETFLKPWRVPTTLSRSLGHTSHRGRY